MPTFKRFSWLGTGVLCGRAHRARVPPCQLYRPPRNRCPAAAVLLSRGNKKEMTSHKQKRSAAALLAAGTALLGWAMARASARNERTFGGVNPRVVLTDTEAFVLGTPEVIAGARVTSVSASPDGRYALLRRDDLPRQPRPLFPDLDGEGKQSDFENGDNGSKGVPPAQSLLLWSSGRPGRPATTLWRGGLGTGTTLAAMVQEIFWLPGTQTALVTVALMPFPPEIAAAARRGGNFDPPPAWVAACRTTLLLVNAPGGTARPLLTLAGEAGTVLSLNVSPTHPVAVCYVPDPATLNAPASEAGIAVRIVRPNGTLGPPVPLHGSAYVAGFSPDGRQVYVSVVAPATPDASGKVPPFRDRQTFAAIDVATNAVTPLGKQRPPIARAAPKPDGEALPVRIVAATQQARRETTAQTLRSVWLEASDPQASGEPRALVTPDCDRGNLTGARNSEPSGPGHSPLNTAHSALLLADASAVLYKSGDVLFAVPIRRFPKAGFVDARRAAQQAATLANAKQIGTALMMYAQDYDEVLPGANPAIADQVSPYLSRRDSFDNPATGAPGFVYIHAGGLFSNVMDPAKTQLGYLGGPNGRAIIFADGHVEWKPDQASP